MMSMRGDFYKFELSLPVAIAVMVVLAAVIVSFIIFAQGKGGSGFQSLEDFFRQLFMKNPQSADICKAYNNTEVYRGDLTTVLAALWNGRCKSANMTAGSRLTEQDIMAAIEELGIVDSTGGALYASRQSCDSPSGGMVAVHWPDQSKRWFEKGSRIRMMRSGDAVLICP